MPSQPITGAAGPEGVRGPAQEHHGPPGGQEREHHGQDGRGCRVGQAGDTGVERDRAEPVAEGQAGRHQGQARDLGLDGQAPDRLGRQAHGHDPDHHREGRPAQLAREGPDAQRRGGVGEGDGSCER